MALVKILACGVVAISSAAHLPTVFMHGMGDSCFNPGMKGITQKTGAHLNSYSVCIPTGPDLNSDTNNGFFMTMDKNIEVFAAAIKNDTRLAQGFNAVGFSQGNSVVRGYIQKYNNPPVSTWLSVHGTVVGVASFPKCDPSGLLGPVCKLLDHFLVGPLAYTNLVQNKLFQADYFRDPKRVNSSSYKSHSQIAQWNNEGDKFDETFATNFGKTKRFVMVKAEKDSMVYPHDGEWWGAFDSDGKTLLAMKETDWYKKDLFGLKTADEARKIFFESTTGDHLQFTEEELFAWVDKHFVDEKAGDSSLLDKDHCECAGPCPKYGKWTCHYANGTIDEKYKYGDKEDCVANCHSRSIEAVIV